MCVCVYLAFSQLCSVKSQPRLGVQLGSFIFAIRRMYVCIYLFVIYEHLVPLFTMFAWFLRYT